jgi:uncharacterized protein
VHASDTLDPLPGLVGFAAVLREAGLPADAQRVQAYLAAVRAVNVADPDQLYWAGRLTLCADPDDLPRYNEAFAAWFVARRPGPRRSSGALRQRQATMAALTDVSVGGAGTDRDTDELRVAASDTEILRHRDIAELTAAEREHLRELIATLRLTPPLRRSMRLRPTRSGRLDVAKVLRAMRSAGGEPIRLAYRDRGRRPRRVVLLVDVSGSMSPYADALLRFAHAVTRAAPATTEVFTVGTRLTRLSRQLRARDPHGDATLLGEQLARLRRLAHAVLWVNPHAGRDGYEPVQSGIAAALPHLDLLLAGHSLATLDELLMEVRRA